MPDSLSVSTGVSLGLLAGIVSGVCYIIANGLNKPKSDSEKEIRSRIKRLTLSSNGGVCQQCGGDKQGGIVPCICLYHKPVNFETGAWFLRQVQRAASLMPWSISTDKLEQIEEEAEGRDSPGPSHGQQEQLREIRDFLETLSAQLAGGSLEGIRVTPLYDHPAYASMLKRYQPVLRNALATLTNALRDALTHLPPRNISPAIPSRRQSQGSPSGGASGAHAQLKRLITRVVEEAASLPALSEYANEPPSLPTAESTTYEDLLATAILNKVIERYQLENGSGGRSSGIHSASVSPSASERSSPRSLRSAHVKTTRSPPPGQEHVSDWDDGEATEDSLELPKRMLSSPESEGDITHQKDNVIFNEVSGNDAIDGSWEENWLFQKKKIKTMQSVPVPMLVPNSNTDYRVLIGDRDIDDTTDLSDNATDEEEDALYTCDNEKGLDSKHITEGQSKLDESLEFEPDSLTMDLVLPSLQEAEKTSEIKELKNNDYIINDETNDIIQKIETEKSNGYCDSLEYEQDSILVFDRESGPVPKTEFRLNEEIHRKPMNFDVIPDKESCSETRKFKFTDLSNCRDLHFVRYNHENEGEYEETTTVPVQRHTDSLRRQHFDEDKQTEKHNYEKEDHLIPGTVAYRERNKWLNYVEMPNNPYSPEAIQKRLRAKSTSSLFDTISQTNRNEEGKEHKSFGISYVEEVNCKEKHNLNNSLSNDSFHVNLKEPTATRPKSLSSKTLKDIHSDEIPQYKRYGRDYYIKEAKESSGGKKKGTFSDTSSISSLYNSTSLENFDTDLTSPGLLIKQFTSIAANQQYTKFGTNDQLTKSTTIARSNSREVLIDYEDTNQERLFSAILLPAVTDEDTNNKFEEILKIANSTYESQTNIYNKMGDSLRSPNHLDSSYMSSSSMDDSIKIYNIQTGQIVKSECKDNVSTRYEPAYDGDDNIEVNDKIVHGETTDSINANSKVVDEAIIIDELQEDKTEDRELEDILSQLPKVRELAKKFVSMDNIHGSLKTEETTVKRRKSREDILCEKSTNKYMHSLTARSISKEFRDELKLSMATPIKIPGGANEVPNGEEVTKESSRPNSPLPEPGTIKTKLAFFESLKSRFNNERKISKK